MESGKAKKWILRIITGALVAISVVILLFSILFYSWRSGIADVIQPAGSVVNIDNGFVEYQLDNRGEDVVFYSHGAPANFLSPVPNPFADLNYSVLSVARPGYFNTMLSTGRTPSDQADLYAKLIDRLDVNEVIMWGVSAGGPAAMEFAVNYPEKCRALILQASYFNETENISAEGWLKKNLESEFGYWFRLNMAKIFSDSELQRNNIETYLRSIMPYPMIKNGLTNDRNQLSGYISPDLSLVDCPVLIIHGDEDRKSPYHDVEELAMNDREIILYTYAGGDHYATLFSGDETIIDKIRVFLSDLPQ